MTRKTLSHAQKYLLCRWVEDTARKGELKGVGYQELASSAQAELGFEVTHSVAKSACEITELEAHFRTPDAAQVKSDAVQRQYEALIKLTIPLAGVVFAIEKDLEGLSSPNLHEKIATARQRLNELGLVGA